MFNNYFTNTGPELSKDITVPTNASIYDYLGNRINQNLFLTPVSEEEIIPTVNTWECKTSTDSDDISMLLVKKSYLTALQNLSRIFVIYLSLLEYSRKK